METEQMMELLLARFNASMKKHKQDILARMQADRKTDREQMLAEIRADRTAHREELKGIMDANTKSIVRAFQEKMDACVASKRNDRKGTTACQDAMEGSIKKMEPNSGEKKVVVGR
jgi:hypothetical protein